MAGDRQSTIPIRSESAAVPSGAFYAEYHGHRTEHLDSLSRRLRHREPRPRFVWLAGDSSLDNKHWFFKSWIEKDKQLFNDDFTAPAINGYENFLQPPRMVQDVSYWINRSAAERFGSGRVVCLNTSVEESTIADRDDELLPQDVVLRDGVQESDFVVVSLGGNDIALRPTLRTIVNIALLTRSPDWLIRSGHAPGMSYFVRLFGERLQCVLKRLLSGPKRPAKVLVCMIYYLDEQPGGSWADFVLEKLGYDRNPQKLQLIIRTLYEKVSARGYHVPGTIVEPLPLFEVLDPKDSSDYVQRVEPSVQGGRKMADAILQSLLPPENDL